MVRQRWKKRTYGSLEYIICQGEALQAMGDCLGLTRERIRQIINRDNLYSVWVEAKKKRAMDLDSEKEKKKLLMKDLCSVILQRREQIISGEPWPSKKAFEYLYARKSQFNGKVNYESLTKMFRRYNEGEASLSALSEASGLGQLVISIILKKMNLPTQANNYPKKRKMFSEKDYVFLKRCSNTSMPYSDLQYFTGYGYHILKTISGKKKIQKITDRFVGKLTYRAAFEIYEAQNSGFRLGEIPELLDVDKKILHYAIHHQGRIKETLKHDIREIYDSKLPERYQFIVNE